MSKKNIFTYSKYTVFEGSVRNRFVTLFYFIKSFDRVEKEKFLVFVNKFLGKIKIFTKICKNSMSFFYIYIVENLVTCLVKKRQEALDK